MKFNIRMAAAILLIICVILFGGFFVGVYCNEYVTEVKHHRACSSYEMLEDFSFTQWEDPQAPVGVRQEYRWFCLPETYDGASMAFYLVHQGVEVYYDDEMVYSLYPSEDNLLTHSPGSHWVMLPFHDSDGNCEVRVVITPYYPDIVDSELEIYTGSPYYIFLNIIRENLLYVMLSVLLLLMGGGMLIVCLSSLLQRKRQDRVFGYMAITTLLIGIWRITDTKLSAFIFPDNVLALDYITVGTLFLICIPFGLAARREVRRYTYPVSIGCAVICLITILGQLCGWWDMRRMLMLAHVMILADAAVLLIAEIILLVRTPTLREMSATLLTMLPIFGAAADIARFYTHNSSTEVLFVIIGFLLYGLLSFAAGWQDASKKIFTDVQTGLYNRARWEQLMNEVGSGSEEGGIILFDLNGLKRVNDRFGHEAGDVMIRSFADILSSVVTARQTLCRWGGDEFAIYVPDADAETLQKILQRIREAVDAHNAAAGELKVCYAVGCAVSADYPGVSRRQLFRLADEKMYIDKNK